MIRVARYSTSIAAALLFIVGAWWMFWSHGARNAWAEAIDQLTHIRSATCNLHIHRDDFDQVSKTYLEGSRVRVEDANRFCVTDFLEGKMLWVEKRSKTARIRDMKTGFDSLVVLGSNPLNDLMQMRSLLRRAAAR